jgi:glutathione synthase/RimK-type ligase-like ATP-grasp enzyme
MGSVPLVYVQRKEIPRDRIKTATQVVHLAEAQDVLGHEEIGKILELCAALGLDFGELDLLRSNDDGSIYILDANKTPGGFGMRNRMNWDAAERSVAIDRLSAAFDTGIRERLVRQS